MVPGKLRSGASLVEVLVVLATIGTLLALLLPAVQKVRSAAARIRCASQLRQVGLAMHMFHDAHGAFPPGVTHPHLPPPLPPEYGPDTDPFPLLNWQARLLPWLEQGALWAKIREAYATDRFEIRSRTHTAQFARVPLLECPADSPRTVTHFPHGQVPGSTSYIGVSGLNDYRKDGVLFLDSGVRLLAITDGASHTLMIGERPPTPDLSHGQWYGGWGSWGAPNAYLGVRETRVFRINQTDCGAGPSHFQRGELSDPCSAFHFWSLHPGGGHFLAADGSVRFLSYAAAPLLPALASRAGGEVAVWPD